MVETWPHVQPFHWEGKCLPCWQATLFENEKKDLRLLISFGFAALGTSDRRRKETPNKQEEQTQKANTEDWRRRKTGKRRRCRVKIRFVLFISILFCGLGVFWDCITSTPPYIYIYMFFFPSFSLTRETQPLYFLCRAYFGFKEHQFPVNRIRPYGPVWISKPLIEQR